MNKVNDLLVLSKERFLTHEFDCIVRTVSVTAIDNKFDSKTVESSFKILRETLKKIEPYRKSYSLVLYSDHPDTKLEDILRLFDKSIKISRGV